MTPVLTALQISKNFGKLVALSSVDLEVFPGEIHAVLGENGAGKSTLMSILAGIIPATSGSVQAFGQEIRNGDPWQMKNLGLQMVHQHFKLVPNFTVAENLALAGIHNLYESLDVGKATDSATELAQELGWDLDMKSRAKDLSVGVLQRVEILKALSQEARILVLDEPTAVLSPDEVEDLLSNLQVLKNKGLAIVLIAHKLSEIMQCADRVTILRHGETVATSLISQTSREEIELQMTGSEGSSLGLKNNSIGKELIQINNLIVKGDRGHQAISDVSFSISKGEVLGVGGVDGNGQVELAEAVANIRRIESGSIEWRGESEAVIGYIPQDRQQDALALDMSLKENMAIAALNSKQIGAGPFLKLSELKEWSQGLISRFEIKAQTSEVPARSLSGGNQQKLVVARALAKNPQLLVAVNPTRGLDFKSVAFVHERMVETAANGAAVLLISTDSDELAQLANRTIYLSRGKLVDRVLGDVN